MIPDENIRFTEEQDVHNLSKIGWVDSSDPKWLKFLVEKGWVKNKDAAMWVIIWIGIIALIVALTAPFFIKPGSTIRDLEPRGDKSQIQIPEELRI